MAKGKGGKPAAQPAQSSGRNNGKGWKKRPKIFDKIMRKLRLMTAEEYNVEKEKSKSTKRKSED
ncbi:MAG: hypothetical protein EBR82_19665 [Caulobacteraceae bacterium]|nr:hypothetical protein [Caulobacteraceae bacterium]